MKDRGGRQRKSAPAFVTTVVRQFAGSRIEKDLIAQVFDMLWSSGGGAADAGLAAAQVNRGSGLSSAQSVVASVSNPSEGWSP